MAVDQDLLDRIAGTVADLYREVEGALVTTIAQRLRADLPLPSPFQEEKLDAIRKLQASARLILASLQATRAKLIRQAVADAYRSGGDAAVADLPEHWFPKSGIGQQARAATAVVPNARVLENIAQSLHRDVGRLDANILRAPVDAYRAVQAGAAARITSGAYTRREASQAAWQRLMDKGIVDFTDRANRRWKLSTYVEMMARTNVARAAVQGQTDRLAAIGIDLVYISDNSQECKRCRPFESKVLRRDGGPTGKIQVEHATKDDHMVTVDVLDTLDGARAKGLFHPNCRHSASAYLPGLTTLKKGTADPEGDKARQKQRALERQIRAAKEQQVGALTPEAKKDAGRKVRAAQASLRAHLAAHPKLKRLPYREAIGAGNLPRASGPSGGPIVDLQPPIQDALPFGGTEPPRPTPAAAVRPPEPPKPAGPTPAERAKAAEKAKAEALARAEQAKAEAQAKAQAEAAEKAKAQALAKAKQEAAEAARRAVQEAEQARQRVAAPGMRQGLRHRTNEEGIAWAHRALPSPKTFPADEQAAIRTYSGHDYDLINIGLRGHLPTDPAELARYKQLVADIDTAMQRSKTPESVLVHRVTTQGFALRGLKADPYKPEEMLALVGKVYVEPGYLSTSVGKGEVRDSDIVLMIRVPAGHGVIDVMPISHYGEGELEVLLQRDSRYVVHNVYKQKRSWVLEIEVVPDGWTPPPGWTPDAYGSTDSPGKGADDG